MPDPENVAYPSELLQEERELIETRRRRLRELDVPCDPPLPPASADRPGRLPFGLALSGGGVRSATFCLGVLQSLARTHVLPRFDFLSTVSGGGFIGGFLGLSIQRSSVPHTSEELAGTRTRTIRWFRENGRYLTPNGMIDLWGAAAMMVRNWFSVHVVVATSLLVLMLLGQVARLLVQCCGPLALQQALPIATPGVANEILWSPWAWFAILSALLLFAPAAWAYWLNQRSGGLLAPFAWCVLTVAGAVGSRLIPAGPDNPVLTAFAWFAQGIAVLAALTFLTWALAALLVFTRMRREEDSTARRPSDRPSSAEQRADVEERSSSLTGIALSATVAGAALLAAAILTLWRFEWGTARLLLAGSTLAGLVTGALLLRTLSGNSSRPRRRLVRNALSQHATTALLLIGLFLGAAFIDTIGQSAYQWIAIRIQPGRAGWGGFASLVLSLFPAGSALIPWVQRVWGLLGKRLKRSTGLVLAVAAVLLAVLYLSGLSVISYAIGQGGAPLGEPPNSIPWLLYWLGGLLLSALAVSRLFGFVNTSSLHDFYVSRLNRTYLGATNPERFEGAKPVTQALENDDEEFSTYAPHENGGPLHVINVTLNETVSGESQIEQLDRHGLPFAIGPCGVSLGVKRHAAWARERTALNTREPDRGVDQDNYTIWPHRTDIRPEALSLGYWMGISGAAFTTGTGYRTTLGTSLLAGLFNVRLGFWWDSGVRPSTRRGEPRLPLGERIARLGSRLVPVQTALLEEFLARFHGPARRRWYLSDGGHFENTAGYELIRRRVPVIVLCDCGADPTYCFEDLGRLVRLARTDFGARIRFLKTREQLSAVEDEVGPLEGLGRLQDLVPRPTRGHPLPLSRAHMAVGQVTWETGNPSLLLVLKPTLSLDLPADLLEYHCRNNAFPQQPTSDQFFDENQWECYRELGSEIGCRVQAVLQSETILALHRAFAEPA